MGYDPAMRPLLLLLVPLLLAAPALARAAPCVSATAACEQWIDLAPGERAMVYATAPLDRPDPAIRRVLIMVHGTGRNADHYFQTATAAGFLAGALGDTLIIAPAIHSSARGCGDKLAPGEVSFSCTGDSWRSGGAALSDPKITSFDFADALLKRLSDKSLFPNLSAIVVAGHSAGGQFVARYAMANKVSDGLGVPVSFVIANPSSYAWPDASRLTPTGEASPAAAALEWKDETPHTGFRFGPFDAAKAPDYDRWPYGLEGRTGGYTQGLSDETLRANLARRRITVLLSQVDVLPLGGFDGSPQAMAQGATRRQRGEAFVTWIRQSLGAKPAVMIVPECGHNDRCVYTTDTVLPVIFPSAEETSGRAAR
jgi:pimeloyl-ACP methyl ester carboxylesterase